MRRLWLGLQVLAFSAYASGAPYIIAHTQQIGSVEAPTLDGGIINSTERRGILNEIMPLKRIKHEQKARLAVKRVPAQDSFGESDGWATRTRVKQLLHTAMTEGKLAEVLRQSAKMHLPASVALVPMVESNYQSRAVSPRGAAGVWQLMPGTAKDYGLQPYERFEFSRSTNAALLLLRDLHEHFNNWELAYAAYNAGSQRVTNAIRKNPDAQSIDELDVPAETKTYVHRLRAINRVIEEISNA